MLIPFLRSRKNWKDRLPIGNEIGIDRFSKIKVDTCSYKKKKEKKKKRGTFFDGGRYHHQAIRISLSRDWYFSAHVVTLKVGWEKEGKREREREKGNGDVPTAASLQHLSSIPFYSHPFNLHDFCAVSPLLPYLILHPFLSLLPFTVRDFFSLRTTTRSLAPHEISGEGLNRRPTRFLYVTQRELSLFRAAFSDRPWFIGSSARNEIC